MLATTAALPAAARTVTFDVFVADDVEIINVSASVRGGERFSFGQRVTRSTTPVDIVFLSDVTGSMGRLTNAASREADDIIARTSTLAGDVAWTVASYSDFPFNGWGSGFDEPFILDQAVTSDQGAAANGLRDWFASGGRKISKSTVAASVSSGSPCAEISANRSVIDQNPICPVIATPHLAPKAIESRNPVQGEVFGGVQTMVRKLPER